MVKTTTSQDLGLERIIDANGHVISKWHVKSVT